MDETESVSTESEAFDPVEDTSVIALLLLSAIDPMVDAVEELVPAEPGDSVPIVTSADVSATIGPQPTQVTSIPMQHRPAPAHRCCTQSPFDHQHTCGSSLHPHTQDVAGWAASTHASASAHSSSGLFTMYKL